MRSLSLLALVVALTAGTSGAEHCESWTTSEPEISVAGHYVDWDCLQGPCMESVWVYEESNGLDGLQRDDEFTDDTCHGMIRGDTIIF